MRPLCSPLPRPTPALLVPCLALATLAAGCSAARLATSAIASPQGQDEVADFNILNGCRPVVPPGGPDHTFIFGTSEGKQVRVRFVLNLGAKFKAASTAEKKEKLIHNDPLKSKGIQVESFKIRVKNGSVIAEFEDRTELKLTSGGPAKWDDIQAVQVSLGPVTKQGKEPGRIKAIILSIRARDSGGRLGLAEVELVEAS